MNATSDKKGSLDVTIMGRSYKVSCADEERDALLQAVDYLDRKMNEIKASGRVGSPDRIAVMAALNIAHELLSSKVDGGFDIAMLKRRIGVMQSMLDEVLDKSLDDLPDLLGSSPQDKLF